MAFWGQEASQAQGIEGWRESARMAADWLVDRAQIRTGSHGLTESNFEHLDRYDNLQGAFRGEYVAGTGKWDVFCPVWHGGQAVKALALAYIALGDERYLQAARDGAEFILRAQITDESHPDFGLIRAYEDSNINTSAILECLDGLFSLTEITGETRYLNAAVHALQWVQKRMFIPIEGLFRDDYSEERGILDRASFMSAEVFPQPGRPLLDDGVFLKGYEATGDEHLRQVALATARRLLRDEQPEGNWINYPPANPVTGSIHPRQAFWWGRPMWMVYEDTGEMRFLDCCRRSAQWYVQAMRSDGGMFRDTYRDWRTPSFGQATSGIACAAILWHDLISRYGDEQWIEPLQRALGFCRSMQFTNVTDDNLSGAILEKVLPPNGSDSSPYYLRDVGTTFYLQALCMVLRDSPDLLKG